ncbi:MAG: RpoL/Rpb11 RNA polymerase subunit family protein [Promethearchaeota archaeon]
MAKKKVVKPEENEEEDLGDLEEDLFEDDKIGVEYPKVKGEDFSSSPSIEEDDSISEEELEFELEEEARFPDYKHLDLSISRGAGKNDFELFIKGQSHGFCNVLVNHLLNIEGVNIAAYKVTKIEPAKLFIRLEDSKKFNIKDILLKAIESLRAEVLDVQKLFQKLT